MAQTTAFESILFPVDFSAMSEAAAPHVNGLARLTGAKVTLIHVLPWLSAWYGTSEIHPAIAGDDVLQKAEAQEALRLRKFRERYFADVVCCTCIKQGAVAETITDTARELATDLIMMPTRGLGPSRRFLIGSTTAKVLHDAPCAVWTSPHLHELRPFAGYHHLLCTVDQGRMPAEFLSQSLRLAACFRSKMSFVTAVPGLPGEVGAQKNLRTLSELFPNTNLVNDLDRNAEYPLYLESGQVGIVVKHAVEEHHVDLVVTNRGHLEYPFGKLRTHVYEIVLESPCPVLSLCISAAPEHAKSGLHHNMALA